MDRVTAVNSSAKVAKSPSAPAETHRYLALHLDQNFEQTKEP